MEEVENDSTYNDEQRQLFRDRLGNLNTEKKTQVARIKQTLAKVLDQNTSLAERIHTLFRVHGITIFSILTAFSMTISTVVLAIIGIFGGVGGEAGGSPPKDEGVLMKMVRQVSRCTQKTCRKGC